MAGVLGGALLGFALGAWPFGLRRSILFAVSPALLVGIVAQRWSAHRVAFITQPETEPPSARAWMWLLKLGGAGLAIGFVIDVIATSWVPGVASFALTLTGVIAGTVAEHRESARNKSEQDS